jgi:hypothetical protein
MPSPREVVEKRFKGVLGKKCAHGAEKKVERGEEEVKRGGKGFSDVEL